MTGFLRNAWYMAAWAQEVPKDGFLARRLLDRPWVIMGAADGSWAMLEDRCPHRFVPLSRGKRRGDAISCGYHGLTFGTDGACVFNPFGGAVPPAARVATLPLVERHGGLWFWPGDPERADPATIPDFGFIDDVRDARDWLCMDVPHDLIVDNLMDLRHAEFLHVETFGVNGSLFSHGKQSVASDADGAIWNRWDITGGPAPAWLGAVRPDATTINQYLHIRWHAPASLALFIGLTDPASGTPILPPMANPHILTPETATTTHYFFTRDHGEDAAAMARRVFLEEDEPMIRAQQAAMAGADFWDLQPVILPSDAAAIRVRRRMMQLAREAG